LILELNSSPSQANHGEQRVQYLMVPPSSQKAEGRLGQLLHWASCGRTADAKQHCDQCEIKVGEDVDQTILKDFSSWPIISERLADTLRFHSSQDGTPTSFQLPATSFQRQRSAERGLLMPTIDERQYQSKDESDSDVLSMTSHLSDSDGTSVFSCKSYFTLASTADSLGDEYMISANMRNELISGRTMDPDDALDLPYAQFASDRPDDESAIHLEEGWDGMVIWPRWIPRAHSRRRHPQPQGTLSNPGGLSNPGRFSL